MGKISVISKAIVPMMVRIKATTMLILRKKLKIIMLKIITLTTHLIWYMIYTSLEIKVLVTEICMQN